ncbi:MAG: sulfite exporter TauE/SafE family protein [Candidatus Melainabacteria bacterium]|nr:sulfite exporter TauE/SafE family protein [Candidatus Melainabacteria bacterium]
MNDFFNSFENLVSSFIRSSAGLPLPMLVALAFLGGLASSLTPCVLPMIPLYLTYIGITKIESKIDALKKSSLFCLGAAFIFSLMGLFASFASFVLIEYRGYVHVAIGIFVLVMALLVLRVINFPLPQFITSVPAGGPIIVGMAFSLVSSPCASPILFAILALASSAGSTFTSTLIMIAYSVGYTGLIFVTSLFTGILKQLDYFKKHSKFIEITCTIILTVIGVFYLYSGIKWFIG